jgi:hypothetical protein
LRAEVAAAQWAIGQWAAFPAEADPRPIVAIQETVWPERGFRTGNAKLAFLSGDIAAVDDVPEWLLRELKTRRLGPRPPGSHAPLRVTGATLSQVAFRTDRGPRLVRAWRVDADDTLGPIWVLDPAMTPPLWPASSPHSHVAHRAHDAMLEADGSTMHFFFTGGAAGRYRYPRTEIVSNDGAVALVPVEERSPLPPGTVETSAGHPREVVVALPVPLANRVLVDLDGSPVPVLPRS